MWWPLLLVFTSAAAQSGIYFFHVNTPHKLKYTYEVRLAKDFGRDFWRLHKDVELIAAEPSDACAPLSNARRAAGRVVLAERGQCSFMSKTLEIEAAGGLAVMVTDSAKGDDGMVEMIRDETERRPDIPAVYLPGNHGYPFMSKTLEIEAAGGLAVMVTGSAKGDDGIVEMIRDETERRPDIPAVYLPGNHGYPFMSKTLEIEAAGGLAVMVTDSAKGDDGMVEMIRDETERRPDIAAVYLPGNHGYPFMSKTLEIEAAGGLAVMVTDSAKGDDGMVTMIRDETERRPDIPAVYLPGNHGYPFMSKTLEIEAAGGLAVMVTGSAKGDDGMVEMIRDETERRPDILAVYLPGNHGYPFMSKTLEIEAAGGLAVMVTDSAKGDDGMVEMIRDETERRPDIPAVYLPGNHGYPFMSKTLEIEAAGGLAVIGAAGGLAVMVTDSAKGDDGMVEMIRDETERRPDIPAVYLPGNHGYPFMSNTLEIEAAGGLAVMVTDSAKGDDGMVDMIRDETERRPDIPAVYLPGNHGYPFMSKTLEIGAAGGLAVMVKDSAKGDDGMVEMIRDETERRPDIPAVYLPGNHGYPFMSKTLEIEAAGGLAVMVTGSAKGDDGIVEMIRDETERRPDIAAVYLPGNHGYPFMSKTLEIEAAGGLAVMVTDSAKGDDGMVTMIRDETERRPDIAAVYLPGNHGRRFQSHFKYGGESVLIDIPLNLTLVPLDQVRKPPWDLW